MSKWVGFPLLWAGLGGSSACIFMLVALWMPYRFKERIGFRPEHILRGVLILEGLSLIAAYIFVRSLPY